MYLGYVFFLYILWLSFETSWNIAVISVAYRMACAKIVSLIQTVTRKLKSNDNLIRADTSESKRDYREDQLITKRLVVRKLCKHREVIKDTLRAMFVHPYCIKIGDILKVVNRSSGFN